MASAHSHAPWRKSILIPFWTLQLFFELLMIGLLAFALSVIVTWQQNGEALDNVVYSNLDSGPGEEALHVIAIVWLALGIICLILTITEIILLARHRLKPLIFLITNVIKSTIWTLVFVFDVISVVDSRSRTTSAIAIIIEAVLLLSFWIPLIYASVIYHRFRRDQKSYKPVNDPLSNLAPTEYPSHYKAFVQETTDDEAGPMPGRKLSYNHQRDTRFESYRQDRRSFSDVGERPIGIPIPQVHVENHDGEAFEMEASRRDFR